MDCSPSMNISTISMSLTNVEGIICMRQNIDV